MTALLIESSHPIALLMGLISGLFAAALFYTAIIGGKQELSIS